MDLPETTSESEALPADPEPADPDPGDPDPDILLQAHPVPVEEPRTVANVFVYEALVEDMTDTSLSDCVIPPTAEAAIIEEYNNSNDHAEGDRPPTAEEVQPHSPAEEWQADWGKPPTSCADKYSQTAPVLDGDRGKMVARKAKMDIATLNICIKHIKALLEF